MKKFILFTVVLYVLFLVSFKENSREPESFAKILKDNPERIQEFLKVAQTYQDTGKKFEKLLSPNDVLTPQELKIFRSKTKSRPGNRTHPVIIISTQALNLLIKNHLKDDDSVVFYLGKYSKKDPKRIVRYNERNSYPYTKEKDTYTYKDLKNRTAFAMQVFGNVSSKDEKSKNSSGLFNPRIIMGAVGKGNHDVEINNRGKNNFMPEKIAVSDIYEISRLCPPPREGCFDDL